VARYAPVDMGGCFSFLDGPRYSVKTLQRQCHFDIIISMGIFIATQIISAIMTPFWRPVVYSIGWIVLGFLVGLLGLIGVRKKSSSLIVVFSVLLVMLACINISHVLTMRSEHVHTCRLNQVTFRNCASEPSLHKCLPLNECLRADILKTNCRAPGREHCDSLDTMNYVFFANMFISFLTFSEPTFWALLLLIRMEMTFPITPDEDDTGTAEDEKPLMDSGSSSFEGAGSGAASGAEDGGARGSANMRWI